MKKTLLPLCSLIFLCGSLYCQTDSTAIDKPKLRLSGYIQAQVQTGEKKRPTQPRQRQQRKL